MPNCRECLHDEMCFSTHTGDSPACCDFLDAARYHDIMQAEREGRLVILPCKVGDRVYYIYTDCTFPADCYTKRMCKGCEYRRTGIEERIFDISMLSRNWELRHPYYLSRESAEKALEEEK